MKEYSIIETVTYGYRYAVIAENETEALEKHRMGETEHIVEDDKQIDTIIEVEENKP